MGVIRPDVGTLCRRRSNSRKGKLRLDADWDQVKARIFRLDYSTSSPISSLSSFVDLLCSRNCTTIHELGNFCHALFCVLEEVVAKTWSDCGIPFENQSINGNGLVFDPHCYWFTKNVLCFFCFLLICQLVIVNSSREGVNWIDAFSAWSIATFRGKTSILPTSTRKCRDVIITYESNQILHQPYLQVIDSPESSWSFVGRKGDMLEKCKMWHWVIISEAF